MIKVRKKQCVQWGACPAGMARAAPDLAGRFAARCVERVTGAPIPALSVSEAFDRAYAERDARGAQDAPWAAQAAYRARVYASFAIAWAAVARDSTVADVARAAAAQQCASYAASAIAFKSAPAAGRREAERAWQREALMLLCDQQERSV